MRFLDRGPERERLDARPRASRGTSTPDDVELVTVGHLLP